MLHLMITAYLGISSKNEKGESLLVILEDALKGPVFYIILTPSAGT